jgi:hypothetical protein
LLDLPWITMCMLLLLQYLDGPEVDCDLVVSEGRVVYGAVTDNWPTVSRQNCLRYALLWCL